MPCPSAEELAALYDCVLPSEQANRLRSHVARCPRCAGDVRAMTRLVDCSEPGAVMSPDQLMRAKQLGAAPAGPTAQPQPHAPGDGASPNLPPRSSSSNK